MLAISTTFSAQQSSKSSDAYLLVANQGDRALTVLDTATGKQVAKIAEGEITGHEVAASPDGRTAFVPIYGDSGVGLPGTDGRHMLVIDLATQKITNTIDFGHGVRPHCVVFNRKDGLLYITTELENSVTIVDPKSLRIVGSIPTGQSESHMLAISSDGRRGYTANVASGTVSVLDLVARKTITVISVAPRVQRISITPDNRTLFTADTTKPQLAVIDTATNKVTRWITLPESGYGTAPTHNGQWLLVAMPKANKVAVVDLKTLELTRTVEVANAPQEIVITPDNTMAYVSCSGSGQVAAINLKDWKVEKNMDSGRGADGLALAMR